MNYVTSASLNSPGKPPMAQSRVLRTEDTVTSEEEDAYSQDFNIPTDHGHLVRNCLMTIITSAVNVLII